MLNDSIVIRPGNYWSFKKKIMQPGFYLHLSGFDSKAYTVKIQSSRAWCKGALELLLQFL